MKIPARLSVLCKSDRGASLIELALVCPLLFLLLFGAIDFGRAYYVYLELTSAAHAGAEYGSLYPSDSTGIVAAASQSAPNVPNLNVLTPVWGCECSDGTSYSASCTTAPTCSANSTRGSNLVYRVQVTTSAVYTTVIPWKAIPASFTLSTTATIRGN